MTEKKAAICLFLALLVADEPPFNGAKCRACTVTENCLYGVTLARRLNLALTLLCIILVKDLAFLKKAVYLFYFHSLI